MKTVTVDRLYGNEPSLLLDLVRQCGGYYKCPIGADGKRMGPLVGYAGKYDEEHQYVGEEYVNFAKAERHAPVLNYIATLLAKKVVMGEVLGGSCTGFCGAPEGGKALACAIAHAAGQNHPLGITYQYIYPEKEITAVATAGRREQSRLIFDRHEPGEGEKWWIVEDVCNNFSTTEKLIELIEDTGAEVGGILCFLNRSEKIRKYYVSDWAKGYRLDSLVERVIPQYRQDDPYVAEDVRKNQVVWKPKKRSAWEILDKAMQQSPTEAMLAN